MPGKNSPMKKYTPTNKLKAINLPPSHSPPEDFREMHLMPVISDLLSTDDATDSPFLRPNSTKKAYPSMDNYLETHLRLLWADFIQPLRETIGKFCKGTQQVPPVDGKPNQRIHFYRNVHFINNSFLSSNTVPDRKDSWRRYNIRFESIPGFDWEKNKRLIYGSLVCLWNAEYRLRILATITRSDPEDLEKGWLTISIEHPPENVPDYTQKCYTMLECEVFYEPYRVVMEVYQQLQEDSFPFKEHLLGWKTDPGVPTYLTNKPFLHNYRVETTSGTIVTIKDVKNINTWPTAVDLGVNPIQRKALHAAMTRQLALIQGPPGTGKTFIGRKIISTLLNNKHLWHDDGNYVKDNARLVELFESGKMYKFWQNYGQLWRDQRCPIVVICLTNQALDQFMEGVLKSTKKVIRIGGQSQSSLLEGYLMSVYKDNIEQEKKKYKDSAYLYHNYRKNGFKKLIQDTVDDIQCLTKKLQYKRKAEIRDLGAETEIVSKLAHLEDKYKAQIVKFNQIKDEMEASLCRSVDVIGLTTTGAARRRNVLTALQPKIVLVEEAAQVLEPHIVASLTTSCQHVIMIGDHKQLRPTCNVNKLSYQYRMDVSLFERLIGNGVPSVMLGVQHRMRPEVARLIVPSVYSRLENHPSVSLHPAVPSVQRNVFFLDHDHQEAREEGGCSYYNTHEAAMALRLAHFLCEQGIEQEKITVLVTYAAQMRAILAHRTQQYKLRSVDRIHITTVDNYQGEENDVIILSLVRNNKERTVGFLRTPNRVCVALSRARHGLFILGNIRLLAGSGSKLWIHVQKIMTNHGELGKELVLRCDRHPQQIVKVKTPENFPMCGIVCKLKCEAILDCGHPCQLPCRNNCHHTVALCQYSVPTPLPCGHSVSVQCGAEKAEGDPLPDCKSTSCLRKLSCGHPCPLKCAEPCADAKCNVQVELVKAVNRQKCGHVFKGPCHLRNASKVAVKESTDCQEPCLSVLRCGHRCSGQCGKCSSSGVHSGCQQPCTRTLICGHSCPVKCGQVCPPCRKPCQMHCLHRSCTRLCGEDCTDCQEKCQWQCAHEKCNHPCFEFCNRDSCSLPCPQLLLCGHPCPGLCGEDCPPKSACPSCCNSSAVDSSRFIYLRDCGHLVPLAEMDQHIGYRLGPNEKIKAPTCLQCNKRISLCHGRYGDHVKAFYEENSTARSVYDQDIVLLHKEITKLLVKNSPAGKKSLSTATVETLLKGKSIEDQWRIYEQMYHLCMSAAFQADLDKNFSFTTVNKKTSKVKLSKSSANELMARHQTVQTRLLLSSAEFLSVECLKDALAQWRRLDLLRQCLTMESAQPKSSTSKTCQQLLSNAKLVLQNSRDWTSQKESDVFAILKSAAALMVFNLVRPDYSSTGDFFHRVTMNGEDWMRCADCQSAHPRNVRSSCSSAECLLQRLAL